MSECFYITTPIYYVNASPHLGHAYTTIVADVARRFHALRLGWDQTYFLTGTDEHGDKIVRAAARENLGAKEYVDKISAQFKALWPRLNISHDDFIRTTDPDHMKLVQKILQRIHEAGDIYFSEYEGLYCYGCERFYNERELVEGKCPDHQTEPEVIRESNYFFRMSRYQDWLVEHIKHNPEFIRPERYKNEVLAFLKEPLEDLCISRPKSRLEWGIPLPFDPDYVTYVWFDALLNYVSALGYPDDPRFARFWPYAQHIVAKDILKPHGIYWPTMLKAAGIPVYQHLNVHGYWNVDQSKMSKSLGNVANPLDLAEKYGLDAFRFFLMREMSFGLDSDFNEEALVGRINSDLANDLGNLFSRTLAMAHRYFSGVVPRTDPQLEEKMGLNLVQDAQAAVAQYEKHMAGFAFHRGLAAVWEFISRMNKYIDLTAPWELAKKKESQEELAVTIRYLLEGLRVISGLIYPVMPETAERMQRHLGLNPPAHRPLYHLSDLKKWGQLAPESQLPKSVALFPRIEVEKQNQPAPKPKKTLTPAIKPEITIDDLSKVDLRVATVLAAEPVPKADKLLKLEVDMGEKRTVVAGIAKYYSPEELVGKQVIVVANLKPAKLMGVVSQGMMLAAVGKKAAAIATLEREVPPGTPVS